MKHVVMYSGGIGSWFAAYRVIQEYGPGDVTLLFADTQMEDEDLYRFLTDSECLFGMTITRIADGRDIWEVFRDKKFLGNSRIDPCSKILKRDLMRKWLVDHCDPSDTITYVGYEWTEAHRIERAARYWTPWVVRSPAALPPYVSKQEMLDLARDLGCAPPRLYDMGFAHNNCGGGCVKAGISAFAMLLDRLPARYQVWEDHEQELRDQLGDVAILTDRSGGDRVPLTLRTLRERIEKAAPLPMFDFGGCACMEDPEEETTRD